MIEAVFTKGVNEITVGGLTQWDTGRKMRIVLSSLPTTFEMHFTNKRAEIAYVVDAVASNGVAVVSIPNVILRNPADAMAWVYLVDGDAGKTVKTIHLPIQRRSKPADYIYNEADVANFRQMVNERLDEYLAAGAIVPGATLEEAAQIKKNTEDVAAVKEFTLDRVGFEHTGDLVRFESFSGCPLDAVTIIEPIQPGSGDPYPAGAGKNLLPLQPGQTASGNGNTVAVQADGSILVTGTAGTASTFVYMDVGVLGAGTYVLHYTADAAFPTAGEQVRIVDAGGTSLVSVALNNTRNSGTFTLAAETSVRLAVRVSAGTTVNHSARVQLEVGSAATEWMPPSNIRPISGRTSAKLTRSGKNMLPKLKPGSGDINGLQYTIADDGSVKVSGTPTATATLPVLGSFDAVGNVFPGISAREFFLIGVSARITNAKTKVNRYVGASAVTLEADEFFSYIYLTWNANVNQDKTVKPSVTIGHELPVFEPYQGETFTLNFEQTVYGGTLDWGKGMLTVDRAMITLNGTEAWQFLTDRNSRRFALSINALKAYNDASLHICSHFSLSPYGGVLTAMPFGYYYMTSAWITIYDEYGKIATLDEWKAYLAAQNAAGTPLQICYKLAEPTTIQLPWKYVAALDGLNNVFCDVGETTVSGRKDVLWLTDALLKRISELEATVAALATAAVDNV